MARAKFFGYSESTDRLAELAIATLKKEGAIIVDPVELPNAGKYDDSELEVLLYELKADLNGYLAGAGVRDLLLGHKADELRQRRG